jgi:hypothetical protein
MTLFHNVTMQAFVFQQYTEKLLKALGLHSCKFKFSVPLRNRVRKYLLSETIQKINDIQIKRTGSPVPNLTQKKSLRGQ